MAQINLLKQQSSSQDVSELVTSLIVKFLVLVLLGVLAYYGWVWFSISRIDKSMVEAQKAVAAAEQKVANVPNRHEIYTRQAQLKQFDSLVSKHTYWSYLLPTLAKVTLKKAVYGNLQATKDGVITMSVSVPDLESIDKFLQVFDLPDVVKNFNSVRLGAFHLSQTGSVVSYTFDAQMQFDPGILEYKDSNAASGLR